MEKELPVFEKIEAPQDSFLLFLDILGFTEKVQVDLAGSVALLKKIKDDVIRLSKTDSYLKELKGITFSDSIIFTIPFTASCDGYRIAASSIIKIASYYQNALLTQGYLSRGYLCRGDVYHHDDVLVGEPLIRAYKREQAIGNSPVVVIDPEIIEWSKLSQDSDEYRLKKEKGWIHIQDRLLLDNFGRFHVDFLRDSGIQVAQGKTLQEYAVWVISLAQKNIVQHRHKLDISEKWVFLENYARTILK